MGQISLFIIALVVFAVGFVSLLSRREAKKHGTSTGEEFVGICRSAIETASQKEERKERALALLRERSASAQGSDGTKGQLSNAEIREALGVASRTVVRYLDELEDEGKVEQIGKTGHAVTYRVKTSSTRQTA